MLKLVQKIIGTISLFFKHKNSQIDIDIPYSQKGIDTCPNGKLFDENSLQEYFADKFLPQSSINNIIPVLDSMPNQDLIMNNLSLNSNSTVKEYHLSSQFDEKLKRWTPSLSFPKKIYIGDDDYV